MEAAQKLITPRTKAILVNNPSNPCGSVYSKDHLLEIVDFARRNDIIIISDEVYGDMVFNDNVFHPMGSISKDVPVVEIGGSAKIFLVPGWRLGWIVLHDRGGLMKEVCHNQERI